MSTTDAPDVASEHRYRPRGAARRLFGCRDAEVLLSGPAGTGKSRACLEKLNALASHDDNAGMRGLIVRKTLNSLSSSAIVTWETHVVAELLASGAVKYFGGSSREPAQYRYANGSTITLGGMDKASKVMSTEYDAIYVQEAIELNEDDWEALTTRLRNGRVSFQQLMADTNPSTPTHWLKQRCDNGQTTEFLSRHEDNPLYFDGCGVITGAGRDYIGGKLDNLTGPRKSRLRHGQWVAAEGVIYDDWDGATHLVDRFFPPKDWTRWWAVDFGYTNPFVLQCWAEDPDGRLFMYREIYRTQRLVEDHAADILDAVTRPVKGVAQVDGEPVLAAVSAGRREWKEPKPRAVICDHDAEDRATLERHLGMRTTAARKTVSDGIQAVQSRLRPAGDGKPRLFIVRDAAVARDPVLVDSKKPASTAEEIPGYVWADSKVKEQPVKEDDHGCDTVRYVVAHRDLQPKSGFRGWV